MIDVRGVVKQVPIGSPYPEPYHELGLSCFAECIQILPCNPYVPYQDLLIDQ